MLPQSIQNLIQLEDGEDVLDQNAGFDRASLNAQLSLSPHEDLVPELCLARTLQLRQVEVRPALGLGEPQGVVVHNNGEVYQRSRNRLAIDLIKGNYELICKAM